MKSVSVEITESDWSVLEKDQQVWKEIDGRVLIIREFKRDDYNYLPDLLGSELEPLQV